MRKPALIALLTAGILLAACSDLMPPPTPTPTATPVPPTSTPTATLTPSPTPTATPTPTPTPLPLTLSSSAFGSGQMIPERFGYFRENVSPELIVEHVPEGARSLVLIMEDRDTPFTHWVAYNIPTHVTTLPESVLRQPRLEDGTLQGLNSNEDLGYIGPFPPAGTRHNYALTLYALDTVLDLGPGAHQAQVLAAMEGHVLTTSRLGGTYAGVEP